MLKYLKNLKLYFDRSFSKGTMKQTLWLLGIMVVVYMFLIALSYLKNLYTQGAEGSNGRWYDVIFTLIDPGSGTRSMFPAFTILCALFGLVLFSGMLISVISNVLERRVDSYVKGETTYNLSNHVVVLGYSKSLISLLRSINRSYRDSYILIMSERSSEELRDWIHSNVLEEEEIEKRVVVMNGVRNTVDDIKRLKLDKDVKEIYILGEENERAHDSINMECLRMVAQKLPSKNKVDCHVLLNSDTMYNILKTVDIDSNLKEKITLHLFNFNEVWAQKALAIIANEDVEIDGREQEWKYLPLDGEGISAESPKHVHLVVVGMTEMGLSLATNAAHILHFPNFNEGDFDTCSQITFIDANAKVKGRAMRGNYQALFDLSRWREVAASELSNNANWVNPMGDDDSKSPYKGFLGNTNFMDQQWEFVEGDVSDSQVISYFEQCANDSNKILTIAFCHESSELNARECLVLPENVVDKANEILVRQKESAHLMNMLKRRYGYGKVRPFGIESECYYDDTKHELCGMLVKACYDNVYAKKQEEKVELTDKEGLKSRWDNNKVALKWSNIFCANMLFVRLRSMGLDTTKELSQEEIINAVSCHEEEIQRTEHNRWNTEKLLMGYRPLRSKKERERWKLDEETMKKEMKHNNLVSNEKLLEIDKYSAQKDIEVNRELHQLYRILNS